MAPLFDKLPTILVLAVLVGIFVALGRHVRSDRLKLWTAAWVLIYCHFFIGLFEPADGNLTPAFFIIDLGSLALSSLFFIASLTSFFESKRLTIGLLILAGLPGMAYTAGLGFERDWRLLYIICLVTLFYGMPLYVAYFRRLTVEAVGWVPVSVIVGTIAISRAWHHNYDFGFQAMLCIGFALPGFLYWRRYPRWSPGVITTVGGFLLWGSVFPVSTLTDMYAPALHINPELWNTPKFFVALGMILTLLEDKSEFLKSAMDREHEHNRQLQKFAAITSRLLTGVDVNSLCHEIAEAIVETSTFRRAVIVLVDDTKNLYFAGSAGAEAEAIDQIKHNCEHFWRLAHVVELFNGGIKLGENSRLLKADYVAKYKLSRSSQEYPPNSPWQGGDRVFIPLQSTRGAYVGCIALDDPRDVRRVTAEEMSKIELLANDLAVTIDNATLHRQLARSEKLAAIGQLVAGVAHELNNPLASIVGYSELLTDEISEGPARQKLDKMIREAQRMKRIIENLLRFARQSSLEKKSANLEVLLQEVLALREYQLHAQDVDVQVQVEPDLPHVALNEDQFKQILLNLLNNSIDALDSTWRKRITIEAQRRENRVIVRFDDNGPGFTDINRVFDPFYTTKPIGKGTGLGLSICYGIVKEFGGEIQAMNLESGGARVVLELPVQIAAGVSGAAVAL